MNKVFLIGRLTKDPDLRYTTSGTPVCQINLAINKQKQEADFINVIVWDKLGENVSKYLTKGSQVAIEGRLQTSKYQDKDDKTVYKLEVIATGVHFLDSAKKENKDEVSTIQNITTDELDDLPLPF